MRLTRRNAHAALVVYDVTNPDSLTAARKWIDELQERANPNIVITLAANKIDLEEERKVTTDEGKEYADKLGLAFREVSAKENTGVQDLFDCVIDQLPSNEIYKEQLKKDEKKNQNSKKLG